MCAGIRCGIPNGGASVDAVDSISSWWVSVRQTAVIQGRVYDTFYCVVVRCVLSSTYVSTDTLNIPHAPPRSRPETHRSDIDQHVRCRARSDQAWA